MYGYDKEKERTMGKIPLHELNRKSYVFMAKVVEHITVVTGMLWWKGCSHTVKIRFISRVLEELDQILLVDTVDVDGSHTPPAYILDIDFWTREPLERLFHDDDVEVFFSTACAKDQFLYGAPAFRVDGLRKIESVV